MKGILVVKGHSPVCGYNVLKAVPRIAGVVRECLVTSACSSQGKVKKER